MENNIMVQGVMSALVSCIDEEENVKEAGMRKLMNWHLSEGLKGFYLTGTTGEGTILQKETRKRVVEIAKDEIGDRGKLIVHVGAIDLKTATELARHASDVGADAISSVPPFYYAYGEEQIYDYYKALSDASGLPVIMYATALAGVDVSCEMVERMMQVPNMIGIKWTNYNYFTMHRIKELNGGNINVINGPDECLICGLSMGADGGIGATYNVMPRVFADIYRHFRAGNIEEAQKAQYLANQLICVLKKYDGVCAIKEILNMLGYDCGNLVYPRRRLKEEERTALYRDLEAIEYQKLYI